MDQLVFLQDLAQAQLGVETSAALLSNVLPRIRAMDCELAVPPALHAAAATPVPQVPTSRLYLSSSSSVASYREADILQKPDNILDKSSSLHAAGKTEIRQEPSKILVNSPLLRAPEERVIPRKDGFSRENLRARDIQIGEILSLEMENFITPSRISPEFTAVVVAILYRDSILDGFAFTAVIVAVAKKKFLVIGRLLAASVRSLGSAG
jgi:hypothetical protein